MKVNQIFSLLFLGTLLLNSCNSSNKEVDNTIPKDFEEISWKDYSRIIGLLSIKYETNNKVTKEIIFEYLRIHSPLEYYDLTFYEEIKDTTVFDYLLKPKETVLKTINRISVTSELQKQTISCILFDFEIWRKLNQIEKEMDCNTPQFLDHWLS
jgi:hypothetical protein